MSCRDFNCMEYGCIDPGFDDYEPPKPTWEDLADVVAKHFANSQLRMEKTFSNLACEFGEWPPPGYTSHRPIWWTLLDEWPKDVSFTTEHETDDVWSDGRGGIPSGHLRTVLTNSRIYMQRGGNLGPHSLYRTYPVKWPVLSYMQAMKDGRASIPAILCREPPPWGWWMPTLKEIP